MQHALYIQKPSEQQVLEGSGLIVPKRHAPDVFSLTAGEWSDTQELLLKAKAYLEERYGHDGYSVGWNTGKTGGQSIPHAHLHVIPRFADELHAGKGIRHWIKQQEQSTNSLAVHNSVTQKYVTLLMKPIKKAMQNQQIRRCHLN